MVALLCILSGCAAPEHYYVPKPDPPQADSTGRTLRQVQTGALALTVGMTDDQVVSYVGIPDRTSSTTYGQATGQPWTGIAWDYIFPQVGVYPNSKHLEVVFQPGAGKWLVNSWQWYDF